MGNPQEPKGIQFLNGNDPVDLGAIFCRGMMEFFINHTGETAKAQYANFMVAAEDMLLSEAGKEAVRKGWDKLGGIG
jgi:hypothetical protein